MGLLSFLQRDASSGATPVPTVDTTSPEAVRARARRRLIGSAVLVASAVVVLPMVLESKPRPLPVDIAIEIPKRDATAAPLVVPPAKASAPTVEPTPASRQPEAMVAPVLPKSAVAVVPASPASSPTPKATPPKAAEPVAKPRELAKPAKPVEPSKPPVVKPAVRNDDGGRVQAMLEARDNKSVSKPTEVSPRFVVQVGAFEQALAAKEARQRVEKMGLHTFVQEVGTAQGKRIRVRLGPYASREEAEKAQARLSAGGIKASVVPL